MTAGEPAPRSRARTIVSFVIAVALIAAAIVAVAGHGQDLRRSVAAAATASPWLIGAAIGLPLANWALMSVSFWVLTRRLGPVTLPEMACLIGAAWLLNYLPLRPGMLGRLAYHKVVNRIPLKQSVMVSIVSMACAGVAVAILLACCFAAAGLEPRSQWPVIGLLPPGALVITFWVVRLARGPSHLALTLLLRYLDLLIWTARYMVVFAIVGHPISWAAAGAIASAVQAAILIPLAGNGLGVREWTVGITSRLLPGSLAASGGALTTTIGLSADLVNRAAELCCALPLGIVCAARLSARKA